MSRVSSVVFVVLLAIPQCFTLHAQNCNLRFELILNNGSYYDIKLQINGSASFRNGGGNICFNYDAGNLGSPTLLTAHNFSGGMYQPMSITQPLAGAVSVNIEYNGTSGNGTLVDAAPAWMDVATLRFSTLNRAGSSNLVFRSTSAPLSPTVLFNDAFTQLGGGTFTNLNTSPLPVELLSFTAAFRNGAVQLRWTSASAGNCLGYRVERAISLEETVWETRGFVKNGMSDASEREFEYLDPTPEITGRNSLRYRLVQLGPDGTSETGPELCVGIREETPFLLSSVYPNPARDVCSIWLVGGETGRALMRIVAENGVPVRTLTVDMQEATPRAVLIPVSVLPAGSYLMHIEINGQSRTTTLHVLH